jgi:PII-like signaling protein
MKGYQISLITGQDRRIGGKPATEWLIQLAKEIGIAGVTTFAGVESFGGDGRRHSAHFFELVDQPVEIMMAMTEAQAATLLEKINAAQTRLFYIKTPIEYGEIGTEASDRDSAVTP